jgi:hypothetical protein
MADRNLALGRFLFSGVGRRDSAELGGCAASTPNSTRSLDRTQLHAFVRVYKEQPQEEEQLSLQL